MKIEFGEKKVITSLNIEAKSGCFALDSTPFNFENCRERFAKAFTSDLSGFYFKHDPGQSHNVAAFMLKIEAVLKLDSFSKFCETNRDSIIWIEPSNFWKSCPMRRSLLTVLIRCGILYHLDRDNFDEALFGQEYVVPTKRAMMRFLFGFTKYIGPDVTPDPNSTIQIRGWKMIFEGKSDEEVKQMLVSPESSYVPNPELPSSLCD